MYLSRRRFLAAAVGLAIADRCQTGRCADVPSGRGVGDAATPTFYRQDIGTAPGRMHEPSIGPDGNLWTSPLDGRLWRYDTRGGEVEILDLENLTGRSWQGLHLWPIAWQTDVLLCTPSLPELWVYHRADGRVARYEFPYPDPSVYGGFAAEDRRRLYLYDTRHQSVLNWDAETRTGRHFPCPYKLTNTLYMSFIDAQRGEYWGSTYTGNDLVRFDLASETWTGHFRCPLPGATPTAGGRVVGETLYVSDHLNGRIIPFHVGTNRWKTPIPVPGFREWFGYLSGGWHFRGQLYFCHSTWTGGNSSLDGRPHHFIGSWTVFDTQTRSFSRLDIPTRPGEERSMLMSDYAVTDGRDMYLLAVNADPPNSAIVYRTRRPT